MAKINILPAKVYNRIAAGEVVERPCSVVKELVENAIDAGATEIEVHIERGGKDLIRVVDNGCGIAREDLQSAFLPHATSKIAKAEDLENILTLGFRGEAIASISSVSNMTITSKTAEGKCYSLSCRGGELGQITEAAGDNGTEVCVEMLFFNAPVRLKFLKSDKNEEAEITNFISRFILNRTDISFSYYADGKKVLQSFGGGEEEALVSVYGAAIVNDCYKIDATKHGIRIYGYIGNQNFFKPNRSYQSVFLNGRYIVNTTISAAISGAYASYMMKRQYPFYVLHIDVPTEIVDVNVHPNKADVRFADNQIIYGCIYSVISAVLDGHTKAIEYVVQTPKASPFEELPAEKPATVSAPTPMPKQEKPRVNTQSSNNNDKTVNTAFGFATLTYEEAQREIERVAPTFVERKNGIPVPFEEVQRPKGFIPASEIPPYVPDDYKPRHKKAKSMSENGAEELHKQFPELFFERHTLSVNDPALDTQTNANGAETDAFLANKRFLEELESKNKQNRIDVDSGVYVGKLFNTYLLYELRDEIYIIDQHAAHERLIYDRLREQMRARKVVQQPMLVPYQLDLNVFESTFIRERLDDIREMGFSIDEHGDTTFLISAVPLDLQYIDLKKFFNEILGDVSGYRAIKLEELLKDKLATAACKAAIKGGMDLTVEEVNALFKLMDGDMGLNARTADPLWQGLRKWSLKKCSRGLSNVQGFGNLRRNRVGQNFAFGGVCESLQRRDYFR